MEFNTFQDSFNFFDSIKYKTNEYFIHNADKKMKTITINTLRIEALTDGENLHPETNKPISTIVNKKAIERFHPDKINNKEFWLRAFNSFPLLSVCGEECKSIKEANNKTLDFSKNLKLFSFLMDRIYDNSEKISVLEIGCGYGNLYKEIKNKCEYIGIDYKIQKSLKRYKNFIEIDESGIPYALKNENYFDVIYSVNVLQHCSKKERYDYFKQGFDILKSGGYFIFSNFIMTENNENDECWSLKDINGTGYVHFFNQLTESDHLNDLIPILSDIGYEAIVLDIYGNVGAFILQKP